MLPAVCWMKSKHLCMVCSDLCEVAQLTSPAHLVFFSTLFSHIGFIFFLKPACFLPATGLHSWYSLCLGCATYQASLHGKFLLVTQKSVLMTFSQGNIFWQLHLRKSSLVSCESTERFIALMALIIWNCVFHDLFTSEFFCLPFLEWEPEENISLI